MHILLAETDAGVRQHLGHSLANDGHVVDIARDGREVLQAIDARTYDVLIINLALPGRDGTEICRYLRDRRDETPVLLLGDQDAPGDRIRGLDAGADDCLAKPFSFPELMARMRAIVRRPNHRATGSTLRVGDISLDLLTRQAYRNDRAVDLTTREFMLLESFLRHPNQVLTRSQLLSHVWGLDYLGASNVVDVYVRYLRNKLGKNGSTRIETVRGAGYRLRAPNNEVSRPVPGTVRPLSLAPAAAG